MPSESDKAQWFNVQIAASATVWSNSYELQPYQTKAIGINDLIKTAAKDKHGTPFPSDVWSGQVSWSVPHKNAGRGRLLQSNPETAMARSFSCGYNIELCQATLDDVEDYAPVGQTVDFGTINTEVCVNSCSGAPVGAGGAGFLYGWSSQNSGIAPISGSASSQSANVYGNSVGRTYINSWVSDDFCYVQVPQAPVTVPPAITAVSPLVYGQQGGPLIISGSGFSSFTGAVTLSFTNPGITGAGTVTSNTQITGTYNVGCGVPLNQVNTLTVSGNWSDGPLPTAPYPISIGLPALGTPTISNSLQGAQPVVGQQIQLTGSQSLPTCMSMKSQSWAVTSGTAVGGYPPAPTPPITSGSGSLTPLSSTCSSSATCSLYWTSPGNSQGVSYSQIASTTSGDGLTEPSGVATGTFSVQGPSAVTLTTPTISPVSIGLSPLYMGMFTPPNTPGIVFSASLQQPQAAQGKIVFVQYVNQFNYQYTTSGGCAPISSPAGVDTAYPYDESSVGATTYSTNDNPGIPLYTNASEATASFSATMYLMWQPSLTSSPVIPVPLGFITWQWSGDAVQNAGAWSFKQTPASPSASLFTPSTSYPPNWSIVSIPPNPPCGLHF